jgi:hypothetical protein
MLRADKAFRAARLKKAEPEYMMFRLSCATARGYCRGVLMYSGGSPSPCLCSIVKMLRADKALCAVSLKKAEPEYMRFRLSCATARGYCRGVLMYSGGSFFESGYTVFYHYDATY